MRIASLVPSSTEMLFALGLGDQVVAVTHECDWPPAAASLPHLTRTVVPAGLSAAEIDRAVRETVGAGRPLYELDAERLAELDPELIVTQAVCDVCAVSYDDVVAVAATLPSKPRVISLDPMTLDEVLDDVRRLGDAADGDRRVAPAARAGAPAHRRRRTGRRGRAAPARRRDRVARPAVRRRALGAGDDPAWPAARTCSAGPASARARPSGMRSRRPRPDVALVMPCGYDAAALGRGGGAVRRAARAPRGAAHRGRRRLRLLLAARARAWSRASSCSGTSCIPTAFPRPPMRSLTRAPIEAKVGTGLPDSRRPSRAG